MLQEISERRRQDEEDEEERRKKEEKLREKLRKAAMEAAERAREEEAEGGGEAPSRRRRADADDEDANAPDSPKRGDVEKAIRNRSKRYQDRFSSEAEEEAWLRKKYGFTETDKLFNIAGSATSYEGVRQALLARGWKEHREEDSMIFDLKWTLKTSDIAFKALNKDQLINHFARNGNLTTKVGLTRNLRNLKWFEDVDMDQFFPRSYDLADPDELCDFVDDFKMVAAENVLKLFLRDGAAMKDCQGRAVGAENYSTCVQLALLVLDAHIRRCNVLDIDDDDCCNLRLSPLEWTLLLGEMCPTLHRDREPLASVSETAPLSGGAGASAGATHWNQVTAAAQLKRQRMVGYSPYGAMQQGKGGVGPGKGQLAEQEYNEAFVEVAKTRKFKKKSDAELRGKAEVMLKELKAMNTQSSLNGYDNVWIVKPAGAVCLCVCVCVCVCARARARARARAERGRGARGACTHTHARTHARTHTRAHTRTHVQASRGAVTSCASGASTACSTTSGTHVRSIHGPLLPYTQASSVYIALFCRMHRPLLPYA